MQPGGMNKGMGNVGHVYGKLTDADGKSVTGASVMLMRKKMDSKTKKMKEVLVKGMITKSNGDFSFEELPIMDNLQLKISSSVFKATYQTITFLPKVESGATKPGVGSIPIF